MATGLKSPYIKIINFDSRESKFFSIMSGGDVAAQQQYSEYVTTSTPENIALAACARSNMHGIAVHFEFNMCFREVMVLLSCETASLIPPSRTNSYKAEVAQIQGDTYQHMIIYGFM